MQDVINRWDKFLSTIDSRLREVLSEAQRGCLQLFGESDLDPGPMGHAWSAMERRAQNLSEKVQSVWDEKVEQDLDDAEASPAVRTEQMNKGLSIKDHIEIETERMRVHIYATAARSVWERVLAEAPKQLSCTQCGGTIEAPKAVAATNLPCPYCAAVNTYEPGMRARMIEHFCAHPLAEEACWNEWMAMRKARDVLHARRDPALVHYQGYERAQIEYWQKYYQVRAQMLPHYAANQTADVRGRMQHYYEGITHERVWAEAGRPRLLP